MEEWNIGKYLRPASDGNNGMEWVSTLIEVCARCYITYITLFNMKNKLTMKMSRLRLRDAQQ